MTRLISIGEPLVGATLDHLREAGAQNVESIVLWLAAPVCDRLEVTKLYVPEHEAASDFFRIPPSGMAKLMHLLRRERLMVAAQVHSHPEEAFHSRADDAWAVVRHVGALSIVVPYFARDTTVEGFLVQTATFGLSAAGRWQELTPSALVGALEVRP